MFTVAVAPFSRLVFAIVICTLLAGSTGKTAVPVSPTVILLL